MLSSRTRVPNLELLSKMKKELFWILMKACFLDTEMSVILISQSCPLPSFIPPSGVFWITIMLFYFSQAPSKIR